MRKKIFATVAFLFFSLSGLFIWQYLSFNDGRLHIVFCDVGQGDAIFIQTPAHNNILLDGGPSDAVLACLSKHMPFWDRQIDMMILSHPHEDHFAGLKDVLQVYSVKEFVTEDLANTSQSFTALLSDVKEEGVSPKFVFAGDNLKTDDGISMQVLAPTKEFLANTSPHGNIGESREFGSLILHLRFGAFDSLFTGDAQSPTLDTVASSLQGVGLEVLQVPHHGSKTGLDKSSLEILSPKLAVISVGKKNRYGHPHKQTLGLLEQENVKTLRTDEHGDIEIVSDGKEWKVQ